ncbi:MAG: sugar phosphate isomerase/epimerase, partial [Planctomycetes bacterium]|nr:sugar phosphate isomerase/epimerase [Planctomycetota bacterium]
QHGLKVVVESGARFSLSATQKHRPNLLEVDDTRQLRLKYLRTLCEWCELLGSSVLSFWSGALPVDQTIKGARSCLMQAVENLSPLAEKYGAKLALEPEPGHFVATLDDYVLAENRSSGAFGLCLDVGHLLVNDSYSPVEALKKFDNQIINIQLDDMPRGRHDHCAPGEGEIDWPALKEALARFALIRNTPACWELARDGHRFHELARELSRFI